MIVTDLICHDRPNSTCKGDRWRCGGVTTGKRVRGRDGLLKSEILLVSDSVQGCVR